MRLEDAQPRPWELPAETLWASRSLFQNLRPALLLLSHLTRSPLSLLSCPLSLPGKALGEKLSGPGCLSHGCGTLGEGHSPCAPSEARSVAAQDGKQEDSESSSEEESDSEEEMQRAGTSAQVSPLPVRFISPAQCRKPPSPPPLPGPGDLSISLCLTVGTVLGESPPGSSLPQVPPRGPLQRPDLQPPRSRSKGRENFEQARRNQTVRAEAPVAKTPAQVGSREGGFMA